MEVGDGQSVDWVIAGLESMANRRASDHLPSHQPEEIQHANPCPSPGSMSFAIKYQLDRYGPQGLLPGDVILANSPVAGGSHLPDLTVITPVFSTCPSSTADKEKDKDKEKEQPQIIFFTASRGHHADIGGITGGSMPATSTALFQEGAEIISFRLVRDGHFDTAGLRYLLVDVPARGEGCSGCRDFQSVESDLRAQVAANHKGAQLLGMLVEEYGLETVHEYMQHIRT